MRTLLLAPDGVWTDVTQQVTQWGDTPAIWPWQGVLDKIGDAWVIGEPLTVERATLTMVHGTIERWMACRVWDTVCTPGVESVSVMRVGSNHHASWLTDLCQFTGRPLGDPHYRWSEMRARWLLWAHTEAVGQIPLDGAHIVVGATHT